MSDERKVAYKYIGKGAFVVDLPARDIYEDELSEYEETVKANITNSTHPCYKPVDKAQKATKPGE